MKKTLAVLSLVLALCLVFGACSAETAQPETSEVPTGDTTGENTETLPDASTDSDSAADDGSLVLTGTAKGFGGNVTATVTVDKDGAITDVTVDAPDETAEVGGAAAPKVAQAIVDAQSVTVDTVSGATFTSTAVIEAVTNALTDAGIIDNYK